MSDPATPVALDATVVQALARLEGYPPLDAEMAARIAVGAGNAVRAATASATISLFDTEPGLYLAELERHAEGG